MSSCFRTLPRVLALALVTTPWVLAEPPQDELSRRVAAYVLTLPNLESYGALTGELADWATTHRTEAKAMMRRSPRGSAGVEANLALLKAEPVLQTLLVRHHLSTEDFLVIPMATMQAGIALLGEQQGHSFPVDRINPTNIALVKAHQPRIDAIMTKARADLDRLAGLAQPRAGQKPAK